MSDLVKRLREISETNRKARWPEGLDGAEDELDKAADRIERLEAFVAKVRRARVVRETAESCWQYNECDLDAALAALDKGGE